MNRTFSIIKPDATKRNITGSINNVIESAGLRIIAQKRIKLSKAKAEEFYSIHADKSFFRAYKSCNRNKAAINCSH
mgnify:CR=1 FL=1